MRGTWKVLLMTAGMAVALCACAQPAASPTQTVLPEKTAQAATVGETAPVYDENYVSQGDGWTTAEGWQDVAIAEAEKQLAGKVLAYNERFDYVCRAVVCTYFPGYRAFSTVADAQTLFPNVKFPAAQGEYSLKQAEIQNATYNADKVAALRSSPNIGKVHKVSGETNVTVASVLYETADAKQLNVRYYAKPAGEVTELFDLGNGYRCVAKADDPMENGKYFLCTVTGAKEGYFEVCYLEKNELTNEMAMVGKTPQELADLLKSIAFAEFVFDK